MIHSRLGKRTAQEGLLDAPWLIMNIVSQNDKLSYAGRNLLVFGRQCLKAPVAFCRPFGRF